ncbi:hypothetical protein BD309DRAFT_1048611 [Dichomitus squalens]|nr:hypothetical protein BD309DRAFT_1048611 [Dichomitus squalens]
MPHIASGKIFVTGASGYTVVLVVKTLPNSGFSVRGTVRLKSKGQVQKEVFKTYGETLEYLNVEDIAKEGAFDEPVVDVAAIAYTVPPFHITAADPDEDIFAAVKGTRNQCSPPPRNTEAVNPTIVPDTRVGIIGSSFSSASRKFN